MADFGPCEDWPVYWICDVNAYSPEVTGYAVSAATRVLWSLSGRRFGLCGTTLRPLADDCVETSWLNIPAWDPAARLGNPPFGWRLMYPAGGHEVRLPSPVDSVNTVRIDGQTLDPSAYRVDDNRRLVRTDGHAWPRHNNLLRSDAEPGTWSVTALYGEDVPDSGRLAMGELVCEICKAASGTDCRLPPGVTNLVRQGVTISYPDVGQLLRDGRTGLYLVDMFIASENPYGLKQKARVYDVDARPPRRAGT